MFTFAFLIIGFVGLMIFGAVIASFVGFFRHQNIISEITDQVLHNAQSRRSPSTTDSTEQTSADNYRCAHCGASVDSDTEISPRGDFKCSFCNSWSSIDR